MVSFRDLWDADPDVWDEQATSWSRLASELDHAPGDIKRAAGKLDDWHGEGADAAFTYLKGLRSDYEDAAEALEEVPRVLRWLADQVRDAQKIVHGVRDTVDSVNTSGSKHRLHFDEEGTGEVQTPSGNAPGDRRDEETLREDQQAAQDLTEKIEQAVSNATDADDIAQQRLAKLTPAAAGLEQEVTGSDNTVAADAIPDGDTSPNKVHKWWNGLNPAQQESVLHDHPGKVGGLDGVPVVARDRANREKFAADRASIETRMAELDENAVGQQQEYTKLQGKLEAMDTITKRLEGETGVKQSYLLNFSPTGTGRAVVATGNPDTADNVVTSVPGKGANLDGIGGQLERSDKILTKAGKLSKADTAAVTWLGYDAPQSLSDATRSGDAEDAAGDLQSFQDGLRATHEGAASTNTVIGHSYGTTAIGEAAQHGDTQLDADNVVLLGSPGVNADNVSELQLPDDADVYASTAENDIIGSTPGWIHGTDPVDDDFGAETFESDPGPSGIPGLGSTEAHSNYWSPRNDSLQSMARIVAGKEPG